MKQNTIILNNLNEMYEIYGKVYMTTDELISNNIHNILIKGEGLIVFTMIVTKEQAVDIINENYTSIIEEKIKDYEGVYGYFGASKALVSNIKPYDSDDSLVMYLEYDGPYWSVNSGLYEGMVIITADFRKIKFRNIMV